MQLPVQAFREYDIRGVADRDLTDAVARGIGQGFGTTLGAGEHGKKVTIAVGRDCRLSSDRLFAALTDGLVKSGVHVVEVGIGPTPMLYASVFGLPVDGGIMITGSHNPGDENGFKMMRGKGSFYGAEIQALRKLIEEERFVTPAAEGSMSKVDMQAKYVDMVTSGIELARTDIPFVIDAGNGSGGPLGLACMKKMGLKPEALFCEMDGRFPNHHPDPTVPKNLDALVKRVAETKSRVGIAYDGDADRLGAVDANGEIIWGDKLMILFSRGLLAEHPGAAIIGEVKCSQTLYDDIEKHGGRPIMWKTGHSLIKAKMKEEKALLAGEMSGHLFFADRFFGYDDAIYASLRLLEILAKDPRSLTEMLADVPRTYTTPELRVDCPDALKFGVVDAVRAHYRAAGKVVNDIDGARITLGTPADPAWGLVRASNTGPVLVLRFEASSPERRDSLHAEVEKVVSEARARLGTA